MKWRGSTLEPYLICAHHISFKCIPHGHHFHINKHHNHITTLCCQKSTRKQEWRHTIPSFTSVEDHQLVIWLETWLQRISINPPFNQFGRPSTIHNPFQDTLVKSYSLCNKKKSIFTCWIYLFLDTYFRMDVSCMLKSLSHLV